MFEGLVRQLILGYLGQYIKDIQKEQLKITLWNEEVLLENVELILEAFDYLQLPFALKQGHVGKLSIKIPWKKLGWDPIIIILEDVVICACQREDKEWSSDAIQRRDFASKKAKLATAELAKLSRRVCDNQTGKSFVSYMTAKILDGIQVSIRNVHVQYRDMLTASAVTLFGLKFSSLTIMRQNSGGVSVGKARGGQVNKLIKIQGLGFYCSTFQGTSDLVSTDGAMLANHLQSARSEDSENMYILDPLDVSLYLSVNRSGKLENDAPQYSMDFELSRLVLSVDEVQLQQILTIYDYLSTCQLREKYGRFRPWRFPLEKKLDGWQRSWWRYAQESVISDVKERLRKTSWKYFGHRLECRRKYVNLYKIKLKCLQQDQVIDEDVLRELEEMEKKSDIDDILSYRSAAERELQAFLVSAFSSSGSNSTHSDKSLEDEQTSGKARGWLNWLSRGMLGAGGTDDSSQFSGVISDDVIQDIYEATKFHPVISLNGDSAATDKIYLSSVKLNIREVSATLRSLKFGYAIASLMLEDIATECKIWEESAVVIASVNSARILNPRDMQAILFTKKVDLKSDEAEVQQPALNIQIDALPPTADVSLSIKVIIQPVEILCDSQFINSIVEFYYILEHVSFQHERIVSSLNKIDDVKARLLSKTEFVISNRKKMMWDVNFIKIVIAVPWGNANSELHQLVFEAGEVSFLCKGGISSLHSDMENQSFLKFINCSTNSDVFLGLQLKDLYDCFKINFTYFEVNILMANSLGTVPLLEKSSASLTLASCIIPDEPVMKALDVSVRASPLRTHFSPSLYKAIMGLVAHFDKSHCMSGSTFSKTVESYNIKSNGHMTSYTFWFSITANLESVSFQVDLENDEDSSYTLTIYLQMVDVWFDKKEFLECWLSTKALRIISYPGKSECETLILSSSEHLFASESAEHPDNTFRLDHGSGNFTDNSSFAEGCFLFHYQAFRNLECICHNHRIWSNGIDIHCYPLIFGLLISFFDKITGCDEPVIGKENRFENEKSLLLEPGFELQKFGFSNFLESDSPECSSIPLECFPFVTIRNHGSLSSLESSLICAISEWRKEVSLQDRRSRSPKLTAKKELDRSDPIYNSAYRGESLPQNLNENEVIKVDLSLRGFKVHFHDSSCILGTISLPVAKSLFSFCDDNFDILCSTDGLSLSCSWWTPMIHDFLWGPSLANLSPVFNIRVKKESAGFQKSLLHLSFGVQHVSCILPPDYLALLICYFSMPEWNGASEQPACGSSEYANSEDKVIIDYKFEILNSNLLVPAYSDGFQFLDIDIQQLYGSFSETMGRDVALKDIPSEYLVMTDKIAERNDCLNIFGRDLSLSLSLLKDDAPQLSSLDQVNGWRNFTLIAACNADVWVRLPQQYDTSGVDSSYPTCIMGTATNCQLHAEGASVVVGSEAFVNVINQFSLIDKKLKVFTGDVIQSLTLMRGVLENAAYSSEPSPVTSMEIRFFAQSLTIRLKQSVKESTISEVIADAEMRFGCAASLVNDKLISLDISFSSLSLFSLLNSVMLAECTTTHPSSSALSVTLSVSEQGEHKFDVCIPSLDIWLHGYHWSQINDIFTSHSGKLSKSSAGRHSTNSSTHNHIDLIHDVTANVSEDSLQSPNMSSSFTPETLQQDTVSYVLQLETLGLKVHVPTQVSGDECEVLGKMNVNNSGINTCGNQHGYVTFSVQSKSSKVVIVGQTMKLKINLDKGRGTVELYGETDEAAWPLFQISQILVEADIINYQMAHICITCDTLDVWLSSHVLHLQCFMQFKVPESGPSHKPLCSVDLKVHLRKFNLLFTHGKWCSSGSLLEIVMRNLLFLSNTTEGELEGSVEGDLQVNYNNIDKVLWEPFIEPWELLLTISRRHDKSALLNSIIMTDIQLKSKSHLNLNVNESLIEVVTRTIDMFEDAWSVMKMASPSEGQGFHTYQINKHLDTGRYAPYIIQNMTSLPLVFYVCKGKLSSGDLDVHSLPSQYSNLLQPGSSVPIYVDETPEEQLFRHRPSQSSDRLNDKHLPQAAHRYILIQFEGTSMPSAPISIDLVGLRYFEVDFSKSSNKLEVDHVRDVVTNKNKVEGDWSSGNVGYVVPVVIDVSVERYSKLIQLYSTVILLNATPVPLEVRFDIPFGVSPKILDPVFPGHEFPLPLHLAEAGYMRWRPLGNTYLWSEAYSISNILSHDNKISFLRSIVCYPSHPSSEPFRCCILVNSNCLPSVGKLKKDISSSKSHNQKDITENSDPSLHDPDASNLRFIHWMTLSSPLVFKNYLPEAVSLVLDNGSVVHTASLSEVETSFFHIDSSHDLTITLSTRGFKSSSLKFPRAETFCSMAKFDGIKFSLSEIITFYPESSDGPLCVTIEKRMDPFSGAREVCISVPFLLYNCTGFPLVVSNSPDEMNAHGVTMPSCYDLDGDSSLGRKDGLALLSSNEDLHATADTGKLMVASEGHIITKSNECKSLKKPLSPFCSPTSLHRSSQNQDPDAHSYSVSTSKDKATASSGSSTKSTAFVERDNKKVNACMYSPEMDSSSGEILVKVKRCLSGYGTGHVSNSPWSSPFPLVPPTGSTSVLVPQTSLYTGHVVSVSAAASSYSGRTRIITFQPRYVISNACDKPLYYKQKGTDFLNLLDAGEHSNIQWSDTTRDLLISVRFDEPGWQWSGGFLPEHLGDAQVKIHNYISGAVVMMRVEVQSADLSIKDETIARSPSGNSGTHIILVSVDDTGFMPYRIDNFSKERLRIFQQRCETFETLVNSYTSCPYAWDEPCYPHRLTIEVPGERAIGSYSLDDVKDFSPVYLPATSEKPERTLFISVHSEGAIKVLSIIDSTYHNLNDLKSPLVPQLNNKKNHNHAQKHDILDQFTERIVIEIPFIGISLMNSYPEELLFACAKGVAVDLMQSLDQQKFALQISSLQIDNQLHNTPYPVILSFDCDNKGHLVNPMKMIDDTTKITSGIASDPSHEPVFSLAVAKWRNKDLTVVSFEYISLRVADFHLELEQEIVLSLVDFLKTISSRLESRALHPLFPYSKVSSTSGIIQANKFLHVKGKQPFSDEKTIYEDPPVIPIGAPWQKIHLLARQQKKIYVELLDLAPVKLSLSFSSSPWMLRDGVLISGESVIHRGLVALADIEGANIHLKQLILSHQLASWESIQEILVRHYTRQFLHEMYKLFGSAGVLGNPMGFARSVSLGIKDFLSVPVRSVFQSPSGLITGMAQGTSSLLSNTVYAISDAATQFSKVAHKGIVAFTFDDQIVAKMEKQQKGGMTSLNKGLINGFFEGLTGLLQSPIKGAEKHGLPGVLSGIALGVTGLVARPAASILEVTGKTAQSIRNRSRVHNMGSHRLRVRLPRPLNKELALKPYSWEEAVGTSVLAEADDGMKLRDEILVICKSLKQGGKYAIITERLILVVSCSSLVDLGKSTFRGIPAEPEWVIETEIGLDSIIHADNNEEVIHIVGSNSDTMMRQNQNQQKRGGSNRGKPWNNSQTPLPLFHANLEFICTNEAEYFLRVLLSTIEMGKDQGWGCVYLLHQSNLK